jgi:hypothetical protein
MMAFTAKTGHPRGWTDEDLKFLISTGMNATNLWRAWGYRSRRPSHTFMKRIEALGYVGKGEQL